MPHIVIEVPSDRRNAALLTLFDDAGRALVGPLNACVKSDQLTAEAMGNTTRDPLMPYGDTPLGTYDVAGYQACPPGDSEERGPYDRIKLTPISGDGQTAVKNGRVGFQIHGGRIGALGLLRPTSGSIRLSDTDINTLLRMIGGRGTLNLPKTVELRSGTGTVGGIDADAGLESLDPSPDLARPTTNVPAHPAPPPFIALFTADRASISGGGDVTVHWQTMFATTVLLNQQPVLASGSSRFTIGQTTTFEIIARGIGPEQKSSITVVVVPIPPPPPPPPPYNRHHDREPHDRFHDRF